MSKREWYDKAIKQRDDDDNPLAIGSFCLFTIGVLALFWGIYALGGADRTSLSHGDAATLAIAGSIIGFIGWIGVQLWAD